MSKIKELKQNKEFVFNFVEAVEIICPQKKTKYVDLLLRMMMNTNRFDEVSKNVKISLMTEFDFIKEKDLENFGSLSLLSLYKFYDSFFNFEDLKRFRKFCEYNERGLIEQNDLSQYKTFDNLLTQLSLADIKVENKDMENQIIKIFDNEEWLMLRPLTYSSSKKYGSNTKWCTTSENNSEHFYRYSKRGVLIYCINKKTGYKVAIFKSLEPNDYEWSFWNQVDERVDSIQTELSGELLDIIKKVCTDKSVKTNMFLLPEDIRIKEEEIFQMSYSIRPEQTQIEVQND